jgi:methionyl-tRNA formyltransferase
MLKIAFFGMGGDFSTEHLRSIVDEHRIVAVIRAAPFPKGSQIRRRVAAVAHALRVTRPDPLAALAREHAIPCWPARSGNDANVTERLQEIKPDVICIAGYRWILPSEVLELPIIGTINCHPSLLPRHRGVLPLFWIYYHDDRETGVTVHWVDEQIDTGDILVQEAMPLPRGYPVDVLNLRNARQGGALLRHALEAVERGAAARIPQDHRAATSAPMIKPGGRMVDFAQWDVERVWHFLAGLVPRFHEPLFDREGKPVRYRSVPGFRRQPVEERAGTVERQTDGAVLYCKDGVVYLNTRRSVPRESGRTNHP